SVYVYACVLMEFTLCVVVYGVSFDSPSNAMTALPYIFAALVTVLSGWAADRYQQRMLSALLPNFLAMVDFIIIIISVRYQNLPGLTPFGMFFAIGGLKRSVGIGAMIAFSSQLGGIVGSNIYLSRESPRYPFAFSISISMLGLFGIIWPVCYYFILRGTNAKRAAIPEEEVKPRYSEKQLAEVGDESPLFRYAT
ncbi:hypothetical protein DM02DRAFT_471818, partial [Periconia macrospinosa]